MVHPVDISSSHLDKLAIVRNKTPTSTLIKVFYIAYSAFFII